MRGEGMTETGHGRPYRIEFILSQGTRNHRRVLSRGVKSDVCIRMTT
jgi:hypothetical protein